MKKKKISLALATVIFVFCLVGATTMYNTLSSAAKPDTKPDTQSDTDLTALDATSDVLQAKNKLDLAQDFEVTTTDGDTVRLSDFMGKPIVLNFWASWCPPCKSEMPEFEAAYQELGEDVEFIMVDLVDGQRETKEIGMAYITEQGYTFPVYYDIDQDAAYTYQIRSIPTTYFINSDGEIASYFQGAIDNKTLMEKIQLILPE